MKALVIIDVQNDFCPGGALAAPEGDKVVPIINKLMDKFRVIVASRDWHPKNSIHFDKWPVHCIADSKGADFHPDLDQTKISKVFSKGTKNKDDGYSAFEATNENLSDYLKSEKVTDVYHCGLTTEYCVKETAMDSIENGFETYIVEDGIAAVQQNQQEEQSAITAMKQAGIKFVHSSQI